MVGDRETVILSACRTPIGSFLGTFKDLSAVDLGIVAVREAVARANVAPADIGDLVMGCVLQAGAGMNVARQIALGAGLPIDVPAETVNRVCGSGLQAVVHAVEAIRVGYVDAVAAGGTESMSNAPYLLQGARTGYRLGNGKAIDSILSEGLTCSINAIHMGITAEEVAARFKISRADQDAFAAESQRRAGQAMQEGAFKPEIVPVPVPQRKGNPMMVDTDEYPRPLTTAETLAALAPAFQEDGTVTAGNASGINDGAAALVVTTGEKARTIGARPLARILAYACTGVDPKIMGIGPVPAVRKVVERAGLTLADIDLFELNEAFAAQSLAVTRDLQLDPAKVNIHGGAIALGHPIGASGARILTTLLYALRAQKLRYGVAALCIGGGMGIAMAVEGLSGTFDCGQVADCGLVAMENGLDIRRSVVDAIVAHAQDASPAECCGVLLGNADGVVEAVPARNLSADPNRFFVDPVDHIKAMRDGRARGLDVVGFYHSHPHSAPVPSPTDLAEAAYQELVHVIVSLEHEPPETRAFELNGADFRELRIQEVEASTASEAGLNLNRDGGGGQ